MTPFGRGTVDSGPFLFSRYYAEKIDLGKTVNPYLF